MRRLPILPLLLCLQAAAQSPSAPPPPLSPQAAYDQAIAPVDITHRDLNNWSDIEKDSLAVANDQAKVACLARAEQTFAGDDLISYARLCALGKQWPQTYKAATTYINSTDPKPQLAMAYTFEVQADLNLDHEKAALGASIAMLHSVPYDALTDDVTTATYRYLQFAYTPDALSLLINRQPFLLDLLRATQPAAPAAPPAAQPTTAPAKPTAPPIPIHTLFEHALEFAALEQYDNHPDYAASIVTDIDQATPATLPPDEAIFIAADRRQYALLGTHFPTLPGALSLLPANETPLRQPQLGSVNVYFLFPPWCAQCIRQTKEIVPMLVRTAMLRGPDSPESKLYIYALLAATPPPALSKPLAKPQPTATPAHPHRPGDPTITATPAAHTAESDKPEAPLTVAEQLRKTPTLVVAPTTLTDFNATDFPFLIVTDHEGIIRLMVPAAPANALHQGGPIEQITDSILEHWPLPPAKP
jgi:hypothetical protein